jgi:hypothetical protein
LDTPYDTLPICLCRIKPAILAITMTDLRSDLRRRDELDSGEVDAVDVD